MILRRSAKKFVGFNPGDPLAGGSGKASPEAEEEILHHVEPEDLVQYGLIPEFIGRLPIVSVLRELSREDLEHILLNTKNSLVQQYSKLLSMDGAQLRFTRDAIGAIAGKAIELGTGARSLRSILEKLMLEIMYQIPDDKNIEEVVINRAVVEGTRRPTIKRKKREDRKMDAA
jgi:ATP-dependent Clp protease ATP-binding subunit ClpX